MCDNCYFNSEIVSIYNSPTKKNITYNFIFILQTPGLCFAEHLLCSLISKSSNLLSSHQGMAKRKRGSSNLGSSGKNAAKSDGKFVIPALLKTEQIEVESNIKPEIFTPCTDSKSLKTTGLVDKTIFYTCGGCGESGIHHLGSEYRLVNTAMLVEVGTQTGHEPSVTEIPVEASESNGRSLDQYSMERNNQNNPVPVPNSSTASPNVMSSDNGKFQILFTLYQTFLCFDFV